MIPKFLKINMTKYVRCLNRILAFLLVHLCVTVSAQVRSFQNFGLEKSEFPSRIECMSQAPTGELYVGTLGGLVIYDGYTFKQVFEKDGLAENAISAISVMDSNVWLGHWAGSITIINCYTQQTRVVDIQEALGYNTIADIEPISDSTAHLVTKDGRIFHYGPKGVEQFVSPQLARDEFIKELIQDSSGFFVVTQSHIYSAPSSLNGEGWIRIFSNESNISKAQYLQGGQWIVGTNEEVELIDLNRNTERRIDLQGARLPILDVCQDYEEYIWLATKEDGIVRHHAITGETEWLSKNNGLSFNQVRDLFCDREGQVWIATAAGLDQFLGRAFSLFDRKAGLPDHLVWDFERVNNWFIIASPSGLYTLEFDSDSQKFSNSTRINLNGQEPRKIVCRQMGELIYIITQEKNLWVGSKHGEFRQIDALAGRASCLEDVNGDIWVGTDDGIIKLDDNLPAEQYSVELGLGGSRVNGIYYSKIKNETWITVLGGGCALYRDGRFRLFDAEQGMTSNVVQDAAFDSEGNPWFATYDEGVFYFKDNQFYNLSDKVTLSSNTTFAIEIDKNQVVWIGHNWGLDKYRIQYDDLVSFNAADGFMGVEVNPGALSLDDQNNLWLGTLMGLERFDPTQVRVNLDEPITRIIDATLGNYSISNGSEYRLDFEESNLKIDFSGISLINPTENTFLYRLVGVHDNWRMRNTNEPIEYGALPPGRFSFEIKTCTDNGTCNSKPTVITFRILPPFYRAWWFYTLLFLFLIAGIYLLDKYRVLSLVDQNNALGEKISIQDQKIIEIEDQLDKFKRRSIYTTNTLMQLSNGDEISENIVLKRMTMDGVSSDLWVDLDTHGFRLQGMVDMGVSGEVAMYLLESAKTAFYKSLVKVSDASPDMVLKEFVGCIQRVTKSLENHRGCNWILWTQSEGRLRMNCYELTCYHLINTQVQEYHGGKGDGQGVFFDVTPEGKLLIISDGYTEQLSAEGTQKYGQRKLSTKLANYNQMTNPDLLETLYKDINKWKGSIELTDDISILCYEL